MTSTRALKANAKPRAKSRMRREIVEAMRGLRKVGTVSDGELEKTALCHGPDVIASKASDRLPAHSDSS